MSIKLSKFCQEYDFLFFIVFFSGIVWVVEQIWCQTIGVTKKTPLNNNGGKRSRINKGEKGNVDWRFEMARCQEAYHEIEIINIERFWS